ncbi:MAG: hypothetical protein QM820_24005 [Minicystis sp.]
MKICLVVAVVSSALGCAAEAVTAPPPAPLPNNGSPGPAPTGSHERLSATALAGPYASAQAACEAAAQASGRPKPAAPCATTAITVTPAAPFSAVILRADDPSDPRFAGSGSFFLAVSHAGAWFVAPKPIDQINGAAGHMYLPEVTPLASTGVAAPRGGVRALIRLRDATSSVCNACEGPEREKRTPAQTRAIWIACGLGQAGKPACIAPIETDEKGSASLANDTLSITTAPGAAPKVYEIAF